MAVGELIAVMKQLDNGVIDDHMALQAVDNLLRSQEHEGYCDHSKLFRVWKEYFQNPTIQARVIMERLGLDLHELIEIQRSIQKTTLFSDAWRNLLYPRSLLIHYGYQLASYLSDNPQFLSSVISGDRVCVYMLEIHPTKGACIYKCKMCLWSGGGVLTAKQIRDGANANLISKEGWIGILNDAKRLGVERIIISGGGETLLGEEKFRHVTEAAIRLGIKTMIYTNGRLLLSLSEKTIKTLMRADWLRVSMHAATKEVYAQLVNRPLHCNDFEIVLKGMRRLIAFREKVGSSLRIGMGAVIQELNYAHIPLLAQLGEHLRIDFLDIRGDCIGISKALSSLQSELMLKDICDVRDRSVRDELPFRLTIADDLLLQADRWKKMRLTLPKRCWIPFLRPAIDPYGMVCACDSIGEPFTRASSPDAYIFGSCQKSPLQELLGLALHKPLGLWCKHCMPGQITLNALFEKIVADFQLGILPSDQPFFHPRQ
ncbi:MAG: radical SAM protein [Patescibacteria group bacterium]